MQSSCFTWAICLFLLHNRAGAYPASTDDQPNLVDFQTSLNCSQTEFPQVWRYMGAVGCTQQQLVKNLKCFKSPEDPSTVEFSYDCYFQGKHISLKKRASESKSVEEMDSEVKKSQCKNNEPNHVAEIAIAVQPEVNI